MQNPSVREQDSPSDELDVQRLTAQFSAINDPGTFLRFSVRLLNAAGAVLYRSSASGVEVVEELLSRQALSWSATLHQDLLGSARVAMTGGQTDCRRLASAAGVWIISCPFAATDGHPRCLSLIVLVGSNPPEPFLVITQLLATLLTPKRFTLTGEPQAKNMVEELLDLLGQALGQSEKAEVLVRLNVALKNWAGCSQVAIGSTDGSGQVVLRSLSNVTSINQRTDYSRSIAKVMRECADRRLILMCPQEEEGPPSSPVLEETVSETKTGQCLVLPLGMAGADPATLIVLLWEERGDRSGVVGALKRTGPLLAVLFTGLLRAPYTFAGSFVGNQATAFFGLRRTTLSGLVAVALTLLGLLPVPFRIPADCLTQPVSIRTIASRFEGILKEVAVQPGDQVQAGALLARLDGKEAELQLASVLAERDKAAKMRDQYLASGETALAQMARLDSLRFEEQALLVREKQQNLLVNSPIAGTILSGDLKRAEGSPVARGQVLFEVAPLESMDVEVAVPEKDIAFVSVGMAVAVRFTAYPDTRWQGTIERIVPKSQIRGSANVFLARLRFTNTSSMLQPGMRGEAKIDAGWRPLAWQLFRAQWHTLRSLGERIF